MHLSLHSTMFSINRWLPQKGSWDRTALHSTMFSINPMRLQNLLKFDDLYIPLCFLLIAEAEECIVPDHIPLHSTMFSINRGSGDSHFRLNHTLHSTMFSINHIASSQCDVASGLYIPLCFLLIPDALRRRGGSFCLYIPLCFLLITYFY